MLYKTSLKLGLIVCIFIGVLFRNATKAAPITSIEKLENGNCPSCSKGKNSQGALWCYNGIQYECRYNKWIIASTSCY